MGRDFLDLNNNGWFDPNEVGSPGQTITLTFTGATLPANFQTVQTVTTLSDGTFSFTGLPAGTYKVQTTLPTGGTVPAIPGNPQNITLGAGGSSSNLFPIQFLGSQSAGVWYMTFAGVTTNLTNSDGSVTQVTDTDIVRLTSPAQGDWQYDVFFRGNSFGLTQGGLSTIDAFTFDNSGNIIISTKGKTTESTTYSGGVGSGASIVSYGEDLLKFTPSTPNTGSGITDGSWSLFFQGSKAQLSGASENVDAVSLVYSGTTLSKILLSTSGAANVGSFSANPQDVVAFTPKSATSLGANTAGTYTKFFVGANFGLSNPTLNNVDALFFLPNASNSTKPSLFISTAGNFQANGLSGNSGDILRFNATGGGPTGLLAGSFNSVALRGSNFGHGTANVTGFYMGGVSSDPNPFSDAGAGGAGAAFAQFLSAESTSKTSLITGSTGGGSAASFKVAQAVSSSNNSSKAVSHQADQFFTKAKKMTTSSVKSLAQNVLARF
jgi:hypothetical protein